MHPPTGRFSKLSLSKAGMAPVTRSRSHGGGDTALGGASGGPVGSTPTEPRGFSRFGADAAREEGRHGNDRDEDNDDSGGDDDGNDDDGGDDDDDEDEEEDEEGPVRSPLTDLFYNVDNLDDETQELVRELFRAPAPEETPPMVIEWCGISNDPDVYAFQLQEVVPRTIRIGSPTSRIPRPSCNCTGAESTPCRHLVWLMDQIAKQTLHDHHPDQPLVLDGRSGFPREIGNNAYARIADFHIDILANTLHCGAGPPTGRPNLHRVREAREILAGLDGIQDDASVDTYAPEIFDRSKTPLESLLWGTQRMRYSGDDEDEEEEKGGDDSGDHEEEKDDDDDEPEEMQREPEESRRGGRDDSSQSSSSSRINSNSDSDSDSGGSSGNEEGHRTRGTARQQQQQRRRQRHRRQRQHQTGGAVQRRGAGGGRFTQHAEVVRDLVERGDLQRTVLRLLVSNDEFFAMFLKLLAPNDKARDPYRKIQQRVEAVLDALLAVKPPPAAQQPPMQPAMPPPPQPPQPSQPPQNPFPPSDQQRSSSASSSSASAATTAAPPLVDNSGSSSGGGGVVSVAWAARHVQHAVEQIRLLLQQQVPRPPGRWARRSAGRALVWILHALVFHHNRDAHAGATQDDRNLYQRLIGNSDGLPPANNTPASSGSGSFFFLLDALAPLHDQVQFRSQLERIRHRIQVNGYREPYMRKLDGILAQMREATKAKAAAAATTGSHSTGQGHGIVSSRPAGRPGGRSPMVALPSAAGAKRQGSGTGTSSDRRPKRMR